MFVNFEDQNKYARICLKSLIFTRIVQLIDISKDLKWNIIETIRDNRVEVQ